MSLRTIIVVILCFLCITWAGGDAFAQAARSPRVVVSADVGIQAQSESRTDVATFDLNREVGMLRATQTLGPYLVFGGGGSVRLWKRVGLGIAVSHARGRAAAAIEADVPHPFFFEFDRTATASKEGLTHREVAYHLSGHVLLPLSPTTLLTLSGGPTYVDASQDLVAAIRTSERGFPFDEVDIVSTDVERVPASAWGYHVGFDVAYWGSRFNPFGSLGVSDHVGVGVGVRYSWAKPGIELQGLRQTRALQVGLVRAVAGIRVGF